MREDEEEAEVYDGGGGKGCQVSLLEGCGRSSKYLSGPYLHRSTERRAEHPHIRPQVLVAVEVDVRT